MKKINTTLTITLFLLIFSVSTSLAQDIGRGAIEGKQLAEASTALISYGQILETCDCQNRAKMIEDAKKIAVKAQELMGAGEMMRIEEAKADMQQVSRMMTHGGNMLHERAKQEGAITDKQKAKLNELGKDMVGLGKLMKTKHVSR